MLIKISSLKKMILNAIQTQSTNTEKGNRQREQSIYMALD